MKYLKHLAIFSLLATICIAFLSSNVPQAHAQSAGCTAFGNTINISGFTVPQGTYCAYIYGQGTYVSKVVGHFGYAGAICSWNITTEIFDKNGNWVKTIEGTHHDDCSADTADEISVNQNIDSGSLVCSTLKSYGSRLTSVCNGIH